MIQEIEIAKIVTDPRTQPRATIDEYIVNEYRLDMVNGDQFPPLTVYSDNGNYYLADGWHRLAASRQIGHKTIDCDVKPGNLRNAILYSCGVNSDHGKRRTNGDKERAVKKLLNDPQWAKWSDREIARQCKVSTPFVSKLRREFITVNIYSDNRKFTDRWGNTSVMDTSNIGKPNADPTEETREEFFTRWSHDNAEIGLDAFGDPIPTPAPKYDPMNYRLFTSPINELSNHIEADSVDAIITDPPYPKEYIYTYEQLAEQARTLLKPGGILVAMAGHPYINTLINLMEPYLKFHWIGCYYMPTGTHASLPYYSVSVYWKPLLIFSNGDWPKTRTFQDVIINDQQDKEYHHWGQGVSGFRRIVEAFTMPNETVLDPFVGGGTTAIAALETGRYFIGSDVSQIEVDKTIARLEAV